MKIITKHNSDKELKIAEAIKKIINKYGLAIPLLSGSIYINQYSQNKSLPKLIINTNYGTKRLDTNLLVDLVHLNMHFYADRVRSIKMTILINKFKRDFQSNNKLKAEVSKGLKVFIKYIVIIFNEINIIRELIKPADFDFIYKSEVKYKYTAQWILDNFDRIKKVLDENNLIWKNKKQIQKKAEIEEDQILPVKKKESTAQLEDLNIDIKKYQDWFS